jgi:RHS repeat-associated protein
MKYCLFYLLTASTLIFADDFKNLNYIQTLTDFDGEPSSYVNGCVNVISGNYTEHLPGFFVPGIQPVEFHFSYTSNWSDASGHQSVIWDYASIPAFVYGYINQDFTNEKEGYFRDEYGSRIDLKGNDYSGPNLDYSSLDYSITNSSRGVISGRNNIKNTYIYRTNNSLLVTNGAGNVYDFTPKDRVQDSTLFRKIKRANSLNTTFHFSEPKKYTRQITQKNYNREDEILSTITYKSCYNDSEYSVSTNDGREISVVEKKSDKKNCVADVVSNYSPKVRYHFNRVHSLGIFMMTRKELPENRIKEISYFKKGKNEWGDVVLNVRSYYPRGRVSQLKEPVGTDQKLITTYKFSYDKRNGHDSGGYCRNYGCCETTTTVWDALDHKVTYDINAYQRLESINRYRGKGDKSTLYSRELLEWQALMYLKNRSLIDENNHVHLQRRFEYDQRGNIIKNTIYGNFTGKAGLITQGEYTIFNESVSTNYTYTNINLMSSEDDGRRMVRYYYDGDSDYLKSKLLIVNNQILQRTFYEYDSGGAVTLEVFDDGSAYDFNDLTNVSERHIKKIKNSSKLPAGLPVVVDEFYLDLDTGTEIPLSKVVSDYDEIGHLLNQSYYDAESNFAYSLSWEYDSFGNLIRESNPLGHTTTYRYDANNNKIYEQGVNPLYHHEYTYDFVNRLIKEEIITIDGKRFPIQYKYDYIGNRISKTDHLGNETRYEYDEFRRLIKTIQPEVLNEAGDRISPTIIQEPTFLGCIGTYIDSNGAITVQTYNARGQPTEIVYPNGSLETRNYTLSGELKEVIASNGTRTSHEYDGLGRVLKTDIFDKDNRLLSSSSNIYNNLHKIEEIDANGYHTYFHYDGVGRISKKILENSITTYHYDSLGRQNEIRNWLDESKYIAEIKVYNALNSIIEERMEDEQGVIYTKRAYTYDEEGKLLEKLCWNQQGLAIEYQFYDALGNITEYCDPQGNRTITSYSFDHLNQLGQFVASSESVNPLGIRTITTHDALGRIVEVEKSNGIGEIVQSKKLFYDVGGNLTQQTEQVIGRDVPAAITVFTYNIMKQITSTTEAASTSEEKTMRHVYNINGQKQVDIKPDGVEINYTYDGLGRVESSKSSDGTIDYTYEYDALNRLVLAVDNVNHLTTRKNYDGLGRVIKEELANGKSIAYEYDGLGRELLVTLPDDSRIGYTYDARMRSVSRFNRDGKLSYNHTYDSFDNNGNLLRETFLNQSGSRELEWNLSGRMVSMITPVWNEQHIRYDDAGNLLHKSIQGKDTNYQYNDLNQLISEQGENDHKYAYDSLYNRILKDGIKCHLNGLNQLTKVGKASYVYDKCGRLLQMTDDDEISTFTYDAFDRLLKVDRKNIITHYLYDVDNRRICKYDSEENSKDFIYQGLREIGSIDSSGKITELRILGLTKGAELGAAIALELNGNVYAPIHDHNGNLTAIIDPGSGNLVETYNYSAFGEETECEKISPWRFSSKRFDEETGFYYFGRRFYDPKSSRWITQDPLGFQGGPNLYAYTLNNPNTHYDLYGLETTDNLELSQWERPDKPTSLIGKIREKIGNTICFIADHCLPIPFVRQGISYVGHRFAGRSHDYAVKQITTERSQNRIFKGRGPLLELDKVRLAWVNGITTSFVEAGHFFALASDAYGVAVHGTHNSGHGFILDILECVAHHMCIKTHTERLLVKNIRSLIADVGGVNGGGVIYLGAYSQGGLITYRALKALTPEERAMIYVTTFGSAKMISGMGLAGSKNYVNSDCVPWISDTFGVINGLICKNSNVVFIRRRNSFPGCAHPAIQNYYEAIKLSGDQFKDKYGVN